MSDRALKRKRSVTSDVVKKRQPRSAKSMQSIVLRTLRANLEPKLWALSATITTIPTGLACIQLNSIAEGSDYNNRVGREIFMQSVDLDYYLFQPATTTNQDFGHVSLVYDAQPNGVGAIGSDIFATAYPVGMSFMNTPVNPDRFKILWQRTYYFQSTVNSGGQRVRTNIKIPAKYGKVGYYSSTATIPSTGALILCYSSNANTGVNTSAAQYTYNLQLNFVDS